MPWAKYDVGWYRDPRVRALSRDAELLYVRAIAFAVDELSDGAIDFRALPMLSAKLDDVDAAAAELVKAKLWLKRKRNFQFPPQTWQKYQVSRAEVEAKRADAAARQREWRARRNAVTNSVTNSVTNARVTQPDTDTPGERTNTLSTTLNPLNSRNGSADDPSHISDAIRAITPTEADE